MMKYQQSRLPAAAGTTGRFCALDRRHDEFSWEAAMLDTSVPNLDMILGDGILERDLLLVVGPAGAGKTIRSFQMAFHVAACSGKAIYVSTLERGAP